jgi:hypothetical protein
MLEMLLFLETFVWYIKRIRQKACAAVDATFF